MKDIKNKINELVDGGCYINKLVWITAMAESYELRDILQDMSNDDFSDIGIKSTIPDDVDEIITLLLDLDKIGFLAECHHQNKRDIKFDKEGNFSSCIFSNAMCTVFYVYAESVEELIDSIIVEDEKLSRTEIESAKKRLIQK